MILSASSSILFELALVAAMLETAAPFSAFHTTSVRTMSKPMTAKPWGLVPPLEMSDVAFVERHGASNGTVFDSSHNLYSDNPLPDLPLTTTTTRETVNIADSGRKRDQFNEEDLVTQADKLEMVESILAASSEAASQAEAKLSQEGVSSDFQSVTSPEKIEAPPVSKILKFAVPAMGVWLCSPLLSMIDTSAVGILAGTVHQAALNPAVAVTDYAALCIAFLYAATTNMVAGARESEKTLVGKPHTSKAMMGAMQLSSCVGIGLGTFLFVFARALLKGIIGNDAVNPAVFASAMKYVRIRALGMPAAAVIGSAQAGCLGMQDVSSPLYVLLVAAIVNFIGDMAFVGSSHPWIGGAAGAAWATVFSQYAAVALFMGWLCKRTKPAPTPEVMNLTDPIMELTGDGSSGGNVRRNKFQRSILAHVGHRLKKREDDTGTSTPVLGRRRSLLQMPMMSRGQQTVSSGNGDKPAKKVTKKDESSSVRGLLAGRAGIADLLRFPSKDVAAKFVPYIVPVTTTQVGRVSGFVAMNHVASSILGTASMAAQQILLSVFYCLCPIPDSLNLTAQSFVPGICEKKPSPERSTALSKTTSRFLYSGGALSVLTVGIVGFVPFLSRFFTTDPAVMALVNMGVPYLAIFFSMHGLMCASEGLLLGQKDLGFLGKMYGSFFLAVPYFMMRVKRAGLSGARAVDLRSVWQVFIAYQLVRSVAWVGRVIMLQRQGRKGTPVVTMPAEPLYEGYSP